MDTDEEIARTIEACGLFDSIDGEARRELVSAFDVARLSTGEVLMREGDAADALFVVRHGRLRSTVTNHRGEVIEIGEIGKHEVVGEMAIITDNPRSATVVAMRDTELFRLPAPAFGALLHRHPELLRPFARVVVDRVRTAMVKTPRPALPATVVLLPTPGTDGDALADALAARSSPKSSVVVRASDAEGRERPAAWLLEIESEVDVCFLVAESSPTEWTRQCLRHADRVVLMTHALTDPAITPVERDEACAARLAELPLEIAHFYERAPDVSAWLSRRNVRAHHVLAVGSDADLDTMARRSTGNATTLVLGGGGARGFAHFGVHRALVERGVPVDAIVGSSAGALVGGLLATGRDPAETQALVVDWFNTTRWRRDMNPPKIALTSGRLMSEGIQSFFGSTLIEDLPINYAAVSCDLAAASPYVHTRGPAWQAVRASGSVPGLFPPVAVDDRVLVDGGLVANLPTQSAASLHPNSRVIAVDVGDPTDIDATGLNATGVVNGWQRMRRRRVGGMSLTKLMIRLTELGAQAIGDEPDLLIRPDIRSYGLIDTKSAAAIIEHGYRSGLAAIDDAAIDLGQSSVTPRP